MPLLLRNNLSQTAHSSSTCTHLVATHTVNADQQRLRRSSGHHWRHILGSHRGARTAATVTGCPLTAVGGQRWWALCCNW